MTPTEREVQATHKYIRMIFCNQLALNANEDLKFSSPKFFVKTLKQKHNLFLEELLKKEVLFDELDKDERVVNQMEHMYRIVEMFAESLTKIPLQEMGEFSQIADAFLIDKKSINGIANKVLRGSKN